MIPRRNQTAPASSTTTAHAAPLGGRPSLYTPELAERLCASIRQHGWSDHRAALFAGVNPNNLPRWKKAHEDFGPALEVARSEFLAAQLQAIASAQTQSGQPSWRARAWLLERTFPEEYLPPLRPRQERELTEEEKEQLALVLQDPSTYTFNKKITPLHLAELQRLRALALAHMEPITSGPFASPGAHFATGPKSSDLSP